ncbi:unnamed protein product [Rotaria socialis]|uniref:F-box domain-containing protein n=3 Tax=Rotaria socialis TaxID=392032 RepID=A0A818QTM7_9BILA|nr:unnamed protein product [Rotaria socialis]CAF4449117.1 unnamed protein product [Rotaria socialis]
MQHSFIQLDDLCDEILIHIFKKLYNVEVLYSLMDVNQRLNRIVHDTIFTRDLCFLECLPDNKISSPLSDLILDRFCSEILPEIGHRIKTLHLERTSMERIIHATNYPNLNSLSLCHIDSEVAMSLFDVECNGRFIDGDTLMKDIIPYMPRLYKFTFNIFSTIKHCDQTNFALNQHIEKTFEYFHNSEIITCIDHFQENGYSQCHIYSYPYKWKVYNNITNNFRGGLFTGVTEVSLYDERPLEDEFFLRIAQSFPLMKELTIRNLKAQNNKQLAKSNNDNQMLSIIEYPNLTRLDLAYTHHDYVELFLFDRKMALPNHLHLRVDYQSLEKVTSNFTRYTRPNNCAKLAAIYFYPVDQIGEHIKKYFPHTCIRCSDDFVLRK